MMNDTIDFIQTIGIFVNPYPGQTEAVVTGRRMRWAGRPYRSRRYEEEILRRPLREVLKEQGYPFAFIEGCDVERVMVLNCMP